MVKRIPLVGWIILAALLTLHSRTALAEVVSYVDNQGRVHYVESLDRVPQEYREQARSRPTPPSINKFDFQLERYAPKKKTPPPAVKAPEKSLFQRQSTEAPPQPDVEIFITSWCPYCRALEGFLREHGISFVKHDIEKSASARAAHARLGGGGIPVTKIGSQVVRGFDKPRLLEALNGRPKTL